MVPLLIHRTVLEVTNIHRHHPSVVNQAHLLRLQDGEIPPIPHLNGRTANTRTVLPLSRNHLSIPNISQAMCHTRRTLQRRVAQPTTIRALVDLLHHRLIPLTLTTGDTVHSRQGASMLDITLHHRPIRTTMIDTTAILLHTRTRARLLRAIHRILRPTLPMGILPREVMAVTTRDTHPTDLVLTTVAGTGRVRTMNMSGTITRIIMGTRLISTARTVLMTHTATHTATILVTTTVGRKMTSPECSSQQQRQRLTSMLQTLPWNRLCLHRRSLFVTVPLT